MSRFRFLKDGEWVFPADKFRFRCCDCGLVHDVEYRNATSKFKFWVKRNNISTAAVRRHMKDKILLLAATLSPRQEEATDE